MGCRYNVPHSYIKRAFWSKELLDLSLNPKYRDRVVIKRDTPTDCSLSLRDVTKEDDGEYRFRIITSAGELSQESEISLFVTGEQFKHHTVLHAVVIDNILQFRSKEKE